MCFLPAYTITQHVATGVVKKRKLRWGHTPVANHNFLYTCVPFPFVSFIRRLARMSVRVCLWAIFYTSRLLPGRQKKPQEAVACALWRSMTLTLWKELPMPWHLEERTRLSNRPVQKPTIFLRRSTYYTLERQNKRLRSARVTATSADSLFSLTCVGSFAALRNATQKSVRIQDGLDKELGFFYLI